MIALIAATFGVVFFVAYLAIDRIVPQVTCGAKRTTLEL